MKVSVITVVLNDREGLRKTFDSVFTQSYQGLEYVVIDGKSTDGCVDLINENQNRITHTVSEPDSGIYEAMNKGIAKATGEYLLFLNAGDYFRDSKSLENLLVGANGEDIIYGDLVFKNEEEEKIFVYPDVVDFKFFTFNSLPHPSSLIRRTLFSKVGLYNERLRICSDWAFFLDAIVKHNVTYAHVPVPISVFLVGGVSSGGNPIEIEKNEYILENYRFFYESYKSLIKENGKKQLLMNSRFLQLLKKLLPMKYQSFFN